MAMYEAKVKGAKRPKRLRTFAWGALKAPFRLTGAVLRRPRLVMSAGAVGALGYFGTPHVGWDYQCHHPMRGGQPCVSVSYCAYYGFQGRRIDYPPYGESCKLVKFLPVDWEKLGTDTRALAATYSAILMERINE